MVRIQRERLLDRADGSDLRNTLGIEQQRVHKNNHRALCNTSPHDVADHSDVQYASMRLCGGGTAVANTGTNQSTSPPALCQELSPKEMSAWTLISC